MKKLILILTLVSGSLSIIDFKSTFAAELARPICNVCNKVFTRSDILARHKRTHAGEKPYECDICGKPFANPSQLTRHKKIHICNIFKCDICEVKFENNSELEDHYRAHIPVYRCNTCPDQFKNESELGDHIRNHIIQDQLPILANIPLTKEMSEFFRINNLLKFGDAWKLCETPADKIRVIEETLKVISANDNKNNENQEMLRALGNLISSEKIQDYIKQDFYSEINTLKRKSCENQQAPAGGAAAVDQDNVQVEERSKRVKLEDDSVMQNENLGFECPQCKEKFKTMLDFSAHKLSHL